MKRLISFNVLIVALLHAFPAASVEKEQFAQLSVQAKQVLFAPDRNAVLGEEVTKLELPEIATRGKAFMLDIEHEVLEVYSFHVILKTAEIILKGERLTYWKKKQALLLEKSNLELVFLPNAVIWFDQATCFNGSCILERIRATACPHNPPGYMMTAEKLKLHRSRDIDIYRATFLFGERPVATVPWLRIRPPRKPGLLPPRLGYSPVGGLIIGPSGYLPFPEAAHLSGHVAARTYQGFEARSHIHLREIDATVDHLLDSPDLHTRSRVEGSIPMNRGRLNIDIDITSKGRPIIDELASHYLERATTHTTSLALWSLVLDHAILETSIEYLQPFERALNVAPASTPVISLRLSSPVLPIASFIWPSFNVGLARHGLDAFASSEEAPDNQRTPHTSVDLSGAIRSATRFAFFTVSLEAALRHESILLDGNEGRTPNTQMAGFGAVVKAPLFRDYTHSTHVLVPYAKYRIVPWKLKTGPNLVVVHPDNIAKGHGLEMGVSNKMTTDGHVFLHIDIYERIPLTGLVAAVDNPFTAFRMSAGPHNFKISVDGSFDNHMNRPGALGFALTYRDHTKEYINIGSRWLGPGNGPHRSNVFSESSSPWWSSSWQFETSPTLEVFADLKAPISDIFYFVGGSRLSVWPRTTPHALYYGVEIRSRCGCIAAGAQASHRPDTMSLDVMTSLTIAGF